MSFKKAARTAAPFKGVFQGASGSGKTFTALSVGTELVKLLCPGKRIALADTEGGSSALYSPPFDFDVDDDFGVGDKKSYGVDALISKMEAAKNAGIYGLFIIDNMTHFWKEQGGLMSKIDEEVSRMKARGQKADSFAAWKSIDPMYRKMMNYIRTYPLHVLMTVRAKQAYEKSTEGGKGSLKKIGVEPEFRDGFEYEVDAQFAIDMDNVAVPLKHRLGDALDQKVFKKAGKDLATVIADWYKGGAVGQVVETPAETPVTAPPKDVVEKVEKVEEKSPETQPSSAELAAKHIAVFPTLETEEALTTYGKEMVKPDVEAKRINQSDYRTITTAFHKRITEVKAAAAAKAATGS